MLETISKINSSINSVVWGIPMLILIIGTGIYLTCGTKFFQISHLKHWFSQTIGGVFKKGGEVTDKSDKNSISQFQALCTALAATIGVGNIAGVAAAIASGGPGAVFWMWLSAFFGMMTNYSENVLGIYYRVKNNDGEWCGGAMYYLRDGLGSKKHCKTLGKVLSVLFSVFCLFASFGIGNMGQINTISTNITSEFAIPALQNITVFGKVNLYSLIVGVCLMLIAGLVIIGGIKRIANVAEKIVPVMAVIYIVGTLIIFFSNIQRVGEVFGAIFRFAFGFKALGGGLTGVLVKETVTWGFKRGVFSNEAGLGSSVMVHSASNVKEPVKQGMWGIFEVFFDTIVVCTLTAFAVLSSGVIDLSTGARTAEFADTDKTALVAQAFSGVFGSFGGKFIAIAVLFFAFSTVLGWSFYGTKAWEYLFGTKSTIIYKTVFVLFIVVGSTMSLDLAWDISDTFNGLMAIPNLIGVVSLSGIVFKITKNYTDRNFKGKKIRPMLSNHPKIQDEHQTVMSKTK